MSFMNEATPTVTVKKKNLSTLVEYCVENKIDFTLKSKAADDFDVEFIVSSTAKAIALGMCLKELKLELNGLNVTSVASIKASKKVLSPKETGLTVGQGIVAEGEIEMAFDDALKFELGTSN
ncbi:MAG: hypothetical protein ACJ77K_10735 [Bacteroidia bacterium]